MTSSEKNLKNIFLINITIVIFRTNAKKNETNLFIFRTIMSQNMFFFFRFYGVTNCLKRIFDFYIDLREKKSINHACFRNKCIFISSCSRNK